MKNNKLVSVIMPVYNVEPYLSKSIKSILNQTYHNFELILVDDGSPDRCPEICDAYAARDGRISVIHKSNGGQAEARNVGMAKARGDYLYFIDSDDYAEPNALEVLIDIAEKEKADLVIADIRVVNEHGNVLQSGQGQYTFDDNTTFSPLEAAIGFAKLDWGPWNKLYARKVHEGVLFPVHRIHEDEAIMFQLFHNCNRIVYTKQILYNYLKRKGSTTGGSYTLRKLDWFDVWTDNLYYVRRYFPEAEDIVISKYLITAIYNLDNLIKLHDSECEAHIFRIVKELKRIRCKVISSKVIANNYKLRLMLATSNLMIYRKIYHVG